MPKFKQKNRRKRKYVKKSSPISELSLSRSWFIKLMPYILMAVGFLTTLAINPPTLQPISMQPLQPIQPIQPIDISLTKPSISFDGILRLFQELSTLLSGIQQYTQILTKELLMFLTSLLTQAITALGETTAIIVHVIGIIVSGITFALTAIGKGIIAIFNGLIFLISQIIWLAVAICKGGAILILNLLTAVWHFIVEVAKAVVTTIEIMSRAILETLTIATIKTLEWLNAAWYFLMTPFRALVALCLKLKPYIDFVLNNFKDSAMYLHDSMSLVFGGLTR